MDMVKFSFCKYNITIEALSKTVIQHLSLSGCLPQSFSFRIKSEERYLSKMATRTNIKDLYGIRIVCKNISSCYVGASALINNWGGYVKHDYIKSPKTKQYPNEKRPRKLRLIQMICFVNGEPFEVQLLTRLHLQRYKQYYVDYCKNR